MPAKSGTSPSPQSRRRASPAPERRETLLDELTADFLRNRPKVQKKRGIVTLGGSFKGLAWKLHLQPATALETLLKLKHLHHWAAGVQADVRVVVEQQAKRKKRERDFLQELLSIVYRYLVQHAADDGRTVAMLRPFMVDNPSTTIVRVAWVPAAAAIVRNAYPEEWKASGLPDPRVLAEINKANSFLNQHIGAVGKALTPREQRRALLTIRRAWPRVCPTCGAPVALEGLRDHIAACCPALMTARPHTDAARLNRREESERKRTLRRSR